MIVQSVLGTQECICTSCPLHGDNADSLAVVREQDEHAPDLLLILGDEGYYEEEPDRDEGPPAITSDDREAMAEREERMKEWARS